MNFFTVCSGVFGERCGPRGGAGERSHVLQQFEAAEHRHVALHQGLQVQSALRAR